MRLSCQRQRAWVRQDVGVALLQGEGREPPVALRAPRVVILRARTPTQAKVSAGDTPTFRLCLNHVHCAGAFSSTCMSSELRAAPPGVLTGTCTLNVIQSAMQ